ncbi:DUF397 domain-containing protein [Nocardia cyriacigeorgica]|uniref:DUF397 domain-containing protein n=1 Tax=Nocardia cyriacigeorgica TaxID=135487 RepID=A0A5R8NNR4_9NOCA|nr:DUF397 domain-containing protein [Nocardia cyriacigeorgica]TLF77308.1 DUF397 domain-containing protein [Nocardia cyriacigeorgica]
MSDNYSVDLSNAVWRKSTRSSGSKECVEVAFVDGNHVGVRDSKNPTGPALVFAPTAWNAFTTALSSGKFGRQ